MKRGPIALSRIKAYYDEIVAFEIHDKRTDQEETLVMSVEKFILSLVRYIPENILRWFDIMVYIAEGYPIDSPKFSCEACQSEMVPAYFESHTGSLIINSN